MSIKKKLAIISATGIVGIGLSIGGASYALFTSSAKNTNNSFTSGTLKITSERGDIPNYGPMFYTQSPQNGNIGAMPTGLWAPGDQHTRTLFLENTGSLEGKLKTISVIPQNSSAVDVSSSSTGENKTAYDDDLLFAKQANVIIWNIKKEPVLLGNLSASDADTLNEGLTYTFEQWKNLNPNFSLLDNQQKAEFLNFANRVFVEWLNTKSSDVRELLNGVIIDNIYSQKLETLVNTPFDTSSYNIKAQAGQSVWLGFTVDFMKTPPANIDPNSMQGKNVYFTFKTDWEQTKNR